MNFDKKQQIEEFQFKKKQKYNKIKNKLDEEIKACKVYKDTYTSFICNFDEAIKELLEYIINDCNLIFPIGKYKGYPVDMILEKDEEYCKWYLLNIQAKDKTSCQILNYLCKKIFGRTITEKSYHFETPEVCLQRIMNTIPMNMLSDINTKRILDRIHNRDNHFSAGYFDGEYFDNNEFCYYGDIVMDYGDFC